MAAKHPHLSHPGQVIRELRLEKGWSQATLAAQLAMSAATLSKVESGKLGVRLDKLVAFSRVFGVDISRFISPDAPLAKINNVVGRRSVDQLYGGHVVKGSFADLRYMAADLLNKKMVPIVAELHAHDRREFGGLIKHEGEEFLYVLEGSCELVTELYAPIVLHKGESVYFDSSMPHGYVAATLGRCVILTVCSAPEHDLGAMFDNPAGARARSRSTLTPHGAGSTSRVDSPA